MNNENKKLYNLNEIKIPNLIKKNEPLTIEPQNESSEELNNIIDTNEDNIITSKEKDSTSDSELIAEIGIEPENNPSTKSIEDNQLIMTFPQDDTISPNPSESELNNSLSFNELLFAEVLNQEEDEKQTINFNNLKEELKEKQDLPELSKPISFNEILESNPIDDDNKISKSAEILPNEFESSEEELNSSTNIEENIKNSQTDISLTNSQSLAENKMDNNPQYKDNQTEIDYNEQYQYDQTGMDYNNQYQYDQTGTDYNNQYQYDQTGMDYNNQYQYDQTGMDYNGQYQYDQTGMDYNGQYQYDQTGMDYNGQYQYDQTGMDYNDQYQYDQTGMDYNGQYQYDQTGMDYNGQYQYDQTGMDYNGQYQYDQTGMNYNTPFIPQNAMIDPNFNYQNYQYNSYPPETPDYQEPPAKFNVKIVKKKTGPLAFIVNLISYTALILLIIIGLVLAFYLVDNKIREAKGDYSGAKYNAYVVLTGSMLPAIKINDVVVTQKVEASKLEVKDIITFRSSDSRYPGAITITHRIVEKHFDSSTGKYVFRTKGDNNNVEDSALVEQENIYGKVILKIPKLGYIQSFLATKGGWIIVILIPCLAVLSYDIMKLMKMAGKKSKIIR